MTTKVAPVGDLLALAQRLVTQGMLSQSEAEGAMLAALNHLAPSDAQAVAERQRAQMPPVDRQRVQEITQELTQARQARMARARAALLEIPNKQWQALGGALDEGRA